MASVATHVRAPEGPCASASAPLSPARKSQPQFYVYRPREECDAREIVQSLTNGLDPALIAPELFGNLLPYMRDQEYSLRVTNPIGSQKLHEAIAWMLNWKPPGQAAETARAAPKEEEVYMPSQGMIADGLDRVLNGGDLSSLDPRLLHFLIAPLREMKQRALDTGDYAAGQRADQGQRNVHNQEVFQATVELQDERTQEDSERADVAEIQLQNIREKWELILEQKREQKRQSIATMQEEFAAELERIDKQFAVPPPPSRAKLSAQCLDLRFKEKHLSRSKRFAEASAMKKLADAMEEKELRQRREEWIRDLTTERQKMIEREKRNEFVREMAWQTTIARLETTAADEIARAEKNAQFLRMKKEKSTNEAEFTKTSRKLLPLLLVKQFGATLPKAVK